MKSEHSIIIILLLVIVAVSFYFLVLQGEITGESEEEKECPSCPNPGLWSACNEEAAKTRINYECSKETNYTCESYSEEKACETELKISGNHGLEAVVTPTLDETVKGMIHVEAVAVPNGTEKVMFFILPAEIQFGSEMTEEESAKIVQEMDSDGENGWKVFFDTTKIEDGLYKIVVTTTYIGAPESDPWLDFSYAQIVVDNQKEPVIKVDDTGWTQEGVNTIVNANNQFAFDLYSQFKEESKDENIFFSPYSISVALAMTYEGARGQTAEEMQSVLHIPEDADLRRPNFAKIINEINKKDKNYTLSTANALWAQKDYQFLEEYTNTVEKYYGGKVTNLDFVGETEKSRQTINTWVENQTNNKIKDLIPPGVLNTYTRLILTNAIYFKGTWVKQFDKQDTQDEDFRTNSGQIVKVPMMKLTGDGAEFNYAETDEIQILEMPYDGEDLSMLILLPKENNLDDLEGYITPEKLSEWRNMLNEQRVDIYIPKFKFETNYLMVDTLKKMGMPSAFNAPPADFSGMDGTKDLKIQEVIHQAFVEVNEEGTEAAAATAVVIEIVSVEIIPTFRADHPFIFIIQQKDTGNILFLGRVSDPSK